MDTILQSEQLQSLRTFYQTMGVWAIVLSVLLGIFLLMAIVARWRMFSKAGEGGWKSLIPIYGSYVTYKICWAGIAYWIYVVLSMLVYLFFWLAYPNDLLQQITTMDALIAYLQTPANQIFLIVGGVFALIRFIWAIVKTWKTSRVFGHGFGFFLGLIFFPTIFELIIGLGSSEYVGFDD